MFCSGQNVIVFYLCSRRFSHFEYLRCAEIARKLESALQSYHARVYLIKTRFCSREFFSSSSSSIKSLEQLRFAEIITIDTPDFSYKMMK